MKSSLNFILGSIIVLIVAANIGIIAFSQSKKEKPKNNENTNVIEKENVVEEKENTKEETKKETEKLLYHYTDSVAKTPIIKIKKPTPTMIYSKNWGVGKSNIDIEKYDFYAIAIMTIRLFDGNVEKLGTPTLTNIPDNLYYINGYSVYAGDDEYRKVYGENIKALHKVLYYVEYAVEKNTNPEVKLMDNGMEIFNISNSKFDGKVITSGEAHLWDTLKVKDEFGLDHYIIPLPDWNYYELWGHKNLYTNPVQVSSIRFSFYQISDLEGVTGTHDKEDYKYANWDFGKTLNVSATYANYKYIDYDEKNKYSIGTMYFEPYNDKMHSVNRGNKSISFTHMIVHSNKDDANFGDKNKLTIKLGKIDLIVENIIWK